MAESEEELKSLLMKVKEESEKVGLKLHIQKKKIIASGSITSWEILGWKKHKLESRLLGEISITSDMQMMPPYGRKWRILKEPLDETERGEWQSWLKAQHSENKDHGSGPITSWEIDGETVETVAKFILGGSKSLQMVIAAMKLKDAYSLEGKLWPT